MDEDIGTTERYLMSAEGSGADVNRLQELERRTYHIDGEVSGLKTQIGSILQSLSRIEQAFHNKPPVNWAAWVGVGITFMAMLVGGVFALAQYVQLTQSPLLVGKQENTKAVTDLQLFQHQAHYEIGILHEHKEQVNAEVDKLWEHIHKLEDQDADLVDRMARAETARKAIGEYVRDHHAGKGI